MATVGRVRPRGEKDVSAADIFERRRNSRRRIREREEQVTRAVGRRQRLVHQLATELRDEDGLVVVGHHHDHDDRGVESDIDYIANERLLLKNELLERDREDLAAENRALTRENAYAK